jgi:hypothetical protein
MTLGDIVTINDWTKAGKPHVVIATRPGRVQLCYFGSARWYLPAWHKADIVCAIGDTKEVRRCKRLLLAIKPSPDGWKRIDVGRYGCDHAPVIVGHVDVPWTWAI